MLEHLPSPFMNGRSKFAEILVVGSLAFCSLHKLEYFYWDYLLYIPPPPMFVPNVIKGHFKSYCLTKTSQ